jgi:hypothetical protein
MQNEIIEKVKKVLAKTENNNSKAEKDTALNIAKKMLQKHGLTMNDIYPTKTKTETNKILKENDYTYFYFSEFNKYNTYKLEQKLKAIAQKFNIIVKEFKVVDDRGYYGTCNKWKVVIKSERESIKKFISEADKIVMKCNNKLAYEHKG